jgi:hypothetical protein
MKAISMRAGRVPESAAAKNRFTDLFARITQEDDGYVVQIRLHNAAAARLGHAVWGEEIADSIESASEMVADVAARFCIPQDHITLEIRMNDMAESTRH